MNRHIAGVLAASAVGALAFATPGLAGSAFKNKYANAPQSRDCGNGDTVDYVGPAKMWPPNHKLQEVLVSATDSGEPVANRVTLTVTPTVSDIAGGDGGPQHDPDYVPGANGLTNTDEPTANVPLSLRSERSGKGEGRTYTLNWTASFDDGLSTCSSSESDQSPFVIEVPHDMRGGASWK